jgi:hypothetical protein
MRFSLTILALVLSLNAAYAASVGICDAMEQTPTHPSHIGHHSHEHSDDHNPPSSVDEDGSAHHHDHAHPGFFSMVPNIVSVTPLPGCGLMIAAPAGTFVSAPQFLFEHPPKATLA